MINLQSFLFFFAWPSLGILSKPTHSSPSLIFLSSSRISSSVTPWPLAIIQNCRNSSWDIYPFPSKSTWSKNSFADNFPKLLFQCFRASSRSISLESSTSNIRKVSKTSASRSALNFYINSKSQKILDSFMPFKSQRIYEYASYNTLIERLGYVV